MTMPIKEFYFSFQEILNLDTNAPEYPHDKDQDGEWFTKMLAAQDLGFSDYSLQGYTTDEIKNIVNALMTIVYNRHSEDLFYIRKVPLFQNDYVLSSSDFKWAMSKLLDVLELTLPKYLPLFKLFKENSADPIKKISSTTSGDTRFNDTPQDEGDFNDDEHSTNVTHTESTTEVDAGSLMERLAEVYKNFKSIILEWSNEFNQLFFKEEQVGL